MTGFWDNVFWVGDDSTPGCTVPADCWIENGYGTFTDNYGTREDYYWAMVRPYGNYIEYDVGSVPAIDYGNDTYFRVSAVGNGTWDIFISSTGFFTHQQATGDYISPNAIDMGAELFGTSGASATRAYFNSNEWEGTDDYWHYQTSNGSLFWDNPPYVGWITTPSKSASGGELWTNS